MTTGASLIAVMAMLRGRRCGRVGMRRAGLVEVGDRPGDVARRRRAEIGRVVARRREGDRGQHVLVIDRRIEAGQGQHAGGAVVGRRHRGAGGVDVERIAGDKATGDRHFRAGEQRRVHVGVDDARRERDRAAFFGEAGIGGKPGDDRSVIHRGHRHGRGGDGAGGAAVIDGLEADGPGLRRGIVAGVEIGDGFERGFVVGDARRSAQGQQAGGGVVAAGNAVLAGEAEHILAGVEIAGDLHRGAVDVGAVRIGEGQQRIDRASARRFRYS